MCQLIKPWSVWVANPKVTVFSVCYTIVSSYRLFVPFIFYNVHKKRIYVRKWRRSKMYIKKKKQSRSFVLVSATPLRRFCLCSAPLSIWAGGGAVTLGRSSRAKLTRGVSSRVMMTLAFVISPWTFLLLLFQGVSPVSPSYCWRIARSSLALKTGSVNWSLFGLV